MSLKRLFLMLSCVVLVRAQLLMPLAQTPGAQTSAPTAEEKEAARKELESGAMSLLDDAVAEAQGLKLTENRVRVQTVAAGLLWPRDEQAARALFKSAAAGIATLNTLANPEDQQYYNAVQIINQLRSELVQNAVARDAALALDILRATRSPRTEVGNGGGYGGPDPEAVLEMQLAAQVAAQDPKQALKMAEESLRKGPNSAFAAVLYQLNEKDHEAATKLAEEIIRRLRPEDLARDYDQSSLAAQLLNATRVEEPAQAAEPPADGGRGQSLPVSGRMGHYVALRGNIVIDRQSRRDLINTIVSAVLSDTNVQSGIAGSLVGALRPFAAEVERDAPERGAALRRRGAELERQMDPREREWKKYQELVQSGATLDALVEAAAKAPPEIRDQLYAQAAYKALGDNDAERARQLAEQIVNPQQRAQTRRSIEQQVGSRAAGQGNYEEARRSLGRLTSVEEKVGALLQVAGTALSKGDRQTARQLFDEARALVVGQARSYQLFAAQLQVAQGYAALDTDEAFRIVESSLDQLNELLDAAAMLDGFGQEAFKDGELRPQGGYMWEDLLNQCANVLVALAPSDFARARTDAKRLRRTDARTLAQLYLARGLLQSVAPPPPSPPGRVIRSISREGSSVIIDR